MNMRDLKAGLAAVDSKDKAADLMLAVLKAIAAGEVGDPKYVAKAAANGIETALKG